MGDLDLPFDSVFKKEPTEKISYLYTPEKIQELILNGNKIFGHPGAALTWGIGNTPNISTLIGESGEKDTGDILNRWAEENNAYVFHSVKQHLTQGDVDHFIVKNNQIIIVDTKKWKSSRKYSVGERGNIIRGKTQFPEGYVKIGALRQNLQQQTPSMRVSAMIVIAQTKVFVVRDKNWYKAPYRLVELDRLEEFLGEINFKEPTPPNIDVIKHFASMCIKPKNLLEDIIRNPEELLK
jgi:hypothetical protein